MWRERRDLQGRGAVSGVGACPVAMKPWLTMFTGRTSTRMIGHAREKPAEANGTCTC